MQSDDLPAFIQDPILRFANAVCTDASEKHWEIRWRLIEEDQRAGTGTSGHKQPGRKIAF